MTFSFYPVVGGALVLGWLCACLKTHCGPLVLLALAVTHARACLVTLRWIASGIPRDWRVAYPQAMEYVKE